MTSGSTPDESLLARAMFQAKLVMANEHAFQQLFWDVMRARHGQEFVAIRPQGAKGDGGNDGYLPATGHYFQVHGPVVPSERIARAADKLKEDFSNLIRSWNLSTPIRAYSFVFNDKYQGTFPDIAMALARIEGDNPGVSCRPFTAGNLEDEFMQLSAVQKQALLGTILPDPARVVRLDYGVLKEVIEYIMTTPAGAVETRFGDLPELGDKIRLNHLCSAWADLIRNSARHSGHVDKYFARNSRFTKQALRDHLVHAYQIARDQVQPDEPVRPNVSAEDVVFHGFRTGLFPDDATRPMCDAVDIVIAYYFEVCDIFAPGETSETGDASS